MSERLNLVQKIVIIKAVVLVIFVPVFLWETLVRIGQLHLYDKASSYSSQIRFDATDSSAHCQNYRLLAAEIDAASDFSWNPFHELANWNTDYLAKQPLCKIGDR